MKRQRGRTYYTPAIKGDKGNWRRFARFDVTDGYVGITSMDKENDAECQRVLLSPAQWKALVAFVGRPHA